MSNCRRPHADEVCVAQIRPSQAKYELESAGSLRLCQRLSTLRARLGTAEELPGRVLRLYSTQTVVDRKQSPSHSLCLFERYSFGPGRQCPLACNYGVKNISTRSTAPVRPVPENGQFENNRLPLCPIGNVRWVVFSFGDGFASETLHIACTPGLRPLPLFPANSLGLFQTEGKDRGCSRSFRLVQASCPGLLYGLCVSGKDKDWPGRLACCSAEQRGTRWEGGPLRRKHHLWQLRIRRRWGGALERTAEPPATPGGALRLFPRPSPGDEVNQ